MQPRFELNAADLYIPSMAFVTYILVVGYMLGVQQRLDLYYIVCLSPWNLVIFDFGANL